MKNSTMHAKVNIVEFTKSEITRLSSFYNAYVVELTILKMNKSSEEDKNLLRRKINNICDKIDEHRDILQVLTGGDRY